MRRTVNIIILLLFAAGFIGCTNVEKIVHERIEKSKLNTGDVVFGVTWPESEVESDFLNGVEMALEEINHEGLYNNRKLRLIFRDNKGDLKRNKQIAREFAKNTDVVAVFGHFYSDLALPSSVTYQEYGLLFMTPSALSYDLGLHGFDMFFRSIPNAKLIGEKAATYSYKLGFNKPVVVWVRSLYGKNMYNIYTAQLSNLGINIENSYSFFPWEYDYRDIIAEMKNIDFDMVFIAVALPDAAYFLRDARRAGINQPFLGINYLAERVVENAGEEYAKNVYTISNFNPDSPFPPTVAFVKKFKEKHGDTPDVWGAYGYDGIKLLAHMVKTYETSNPRILASNLRYLEEWPGVTGYHSFTSRGEVRSKPLYLNKLVGNEFMVIDVDTLHQVDLFQTFNYELRDKLEKGYLGLDESGDRVTILLPDHSLFTGQESFRMSALGDTILRTISEILVAEPSVYIDIEGFAEEVFNSTFNDVLSGTSQLLDVTLYKASQTAKYMYKLGISRSRVKVSGRGFTNPREMAQAFASRKAFSNRVELTLRKMETSGQLPEQVATEEQNKK